MAKAYQHQVNPRSHLSAVRLSYPGVVRLPGWLLIKADLDLQAHFLAVDHEEERVGLGWTAGREISPIKHATCLVGATLTACLFWIYTDSSKGPD